MLRRAWIRKSTASLILAALIFLGILVSGAQAAESIHVWTDEAYALQKVANLGNVWPGTTSPLPDNVLASPDLIRLNDGRLFLCYFLHDTSGIAYIYYQISSDGGASWTAPQQIASTPSGLDPTADQLPNGQIIVTYAHYMNGVHKIAVNAVKSTLNDNTYSSWGAAVEVVPPENETSPGVFTGNALVPSVIARDNNEVLIAFSRGSEQNLTDLYLKKSTDGGNTWLPGTTLIYGSEIYDSKASLIELDNGELLCAFYKTPPFPFDSTQKRNGDILLVRSANSGQTWSGPTTISAEANRDECWVNLLQLESGELYAAFTLDEGNKDPNLLPSTKIMKSSDRGASWSYSEQLASPERRTWPTLTQNANNGSVVLIADNNGWFNWAGRADFNLARKKELAVSYSMDNIFWATFSDYMQRHLSVNYTATNEGDGPLNVTVTDVSATQMVQPVTPLPYLVTGSLEHQASVPFTLKYSVPSGTSSFNTRLQINLTDSSGSSTLTEASYTAGLPSDTPVVTPSTYHFSQYDNISAGGMNGDWIMIANTGTLATDVDIYVGNMSNPVATRTLAPGGSASWSAAPQTATGPVKVVSREGQPLAVSQRVLFKYSFNEVSAIDGSKLDNKYYYPWYDGSGFKDWLLVSNPDTANSVYYEVRVAGVVRSQGTIVPGGRVAPMFSGLYGGPVVVEAWTNQSKTAAANITTSQRVLFNDTLPSGTFNELQGIPEGDLSSHYYWPTYDNVNAADWVIIGNPDTASPIYYELKVAGTLRSSGAIGSGSYAAPRISGLNGSNVELSTWTNSARTTPADSIATQRIIRGSSLEELPAVPAESVGSHYYWNWYDQSVPGVYNWLQLVNHQSSSEVRAEVWIGGALKATHILSPGEIEYPFFSGFMGGPVEVRAYRNGGAWSNPADRVGILASQSVLWNGFYNEITGIKPVE